MTKKFRVVCYLRVDQEDPEALTWEEAMYEKRHLEFIQPENIYVIEEVEE